MVALHGHVKAGLHVSTSGVLGGALNEGGPPVVMLLALKGWHKDDVKGK